MVAKREEIQSTRLSVICTFSSSLELSIEKVICNH